jgi:hypothetical protein
MNTIILSSLITMTFPYYNNNIFFVIIMIDLLKYDVILNHNVHCIGLSNKNCHVVDIDNKIPFNGSIIFNMRISFFIIIMRDDYNSFIFEI